MRTSKVHRKQAGMTGMLLLLSCFSRVWLCNPIEGSPPGSSIPGILRQEYWSGLPFPSPTHACMLSHFSHLQLCATLWTAVHQAPPSLGFSGKNTGVGCHFLLQEWHGGKLQIRKMTLQDESHGPKNLIFFIKLLQSIFLTLSYHFLW